MGLKHLIFEQAVVQFKGGEFPVQGLSIEHVTFIIKHHSHKLNDLFNRVLAKAQDPEGEFSAEEVGSMILPFLDEAPEVGALIIACGAGDPSDVTLARKLPLPVQLDALEQILRLTFDAAGGPKKFLETVIRLSQGTRGLLAQLTEAPKA